MIRAQIYLTKKERAQLHALSKETGRSQSELIREAIDRFIEVHTTKMKNKLDILKEVRGIWADRDDLPDFKLLRKEFDRDN